MATVLTLVRRSLWHVLISAVGGAAYSWWRDRENNSTPGPAEWPPLAPDSGGTATGRSAAAEPVKPAATGSTIRPALTDSGARPARSSVVNSLVDAPEARSSAASGLWAEPLDDGSCPISHPVKANDNSGIFHVPDGRFYNRTKAERCYVSGDAAAADGYRQAKN